MAKEAAKEYQSSLDELTFNSKLHINVLTMLAEENIDYAENIVQVIENHINKATPDRKLPTLYLIDSILKNLSKTTYPTLFAQNIVSTFIAVFEQCDEKKRQSMYKLRQTWNEVFTNKKLYAIDVRVKQVDPAWPITAKQLESVPSIHVNPKFLNNQEDALSSSGSTKASDDEINVKMKKEDEEKLRQELIEEEAKRKEDEKLKAQQLEEERRRKEEENENIMREALLAKQQKLMKLQQQRLEYELEKTKKDLQEKERLLNKKAQEEAKAQKKLVYSNKQNRDEEVEAEQKAENEMRKNIDAEIRRKTEEKARRKGDERKKKKGLDKKTSRAKDSSKFKKSKALSSASYDNKESQPSSEAPPEKKVKISKEGEPSKTLPADIAELFGTEDVDYRQKSAVPSIMSVSSDMQFDYNSPQQKRWAQFKENKPDEFPFAQPRLSIDEETAKQMYGVSDMNPSPAININDIEHILEQANNQIMKGKLSAQQYDELQEQLNQLKRVQMMMAEMKRLKQMQHSHLDRSGSNRHMPPMKPPPKPPILATTKAPLLQIPKAGLLQNPSTHYSSNTLDIDRKTLLETPRIERPHLLNSPRKGLLGDRPSQESRTASSSRRLRETPMELDEDLNPSAQPLLDIPIDQEMSDQEYFKKREFLHMSKHSHKFAGPEDPRQRKRFPERKEKSPPVLHEREEKRLDMFRNYQDDLLVTKHGKMNKDSKNESAPSIMSVPMRKPAPFAPVPSCLEPYEYFMNRLPRPPAPLNPFGQQSFQHPVTVNPGVQTSNVDVNALFSKLISAGIINRKKNNQAMPSSENAATSQASNSTTDLFSQLIGAGIINRKKSSTENSDSQVSMQKHDATSTVPNTKANEQMRTVTPPTVVKEDIPDLTDFSVEKLKKKLNEVVDKMYVGAQCNSCGVRFRNQSDNKYKEHLDWHFRQNKKEKEEARVIRNRRFFYNLNDWIQFEEIGDLDEKFVSNYFENMLQSIHSAIGSGEGGPNSALDRTANNCRVPSKNDQDNVCHICKESFEQFYDQEEEEWFLRDAIKINDKIYHPICYQDNDGNSSLLETPESANPESVPDPINNPLAYVNNPLAYLQALSNKSKETSQPIDAIAKQHLKSETMHITETVAPMVRNVSEPALSSLSDSNDSPKLTQMLKARSKTDSPLTVIKTEKLDETHQMDTAKNTDSKQIENNDHKKDKELVGNTEIKQESNGTIQKKL